MSFWPMPVISKTRIVFNALLALERGSVTTPTFRCPRLMGTSGYVHIYKCATLLAANVTAEMPVLPCRTPSSATCELICLLVMVLPFLLRPCVSASGRSPCTVTAGGCLVSCLSLRWLRWAPLCARLSVLEGLRCRHSLRWWWPCFSSAHVMSCICVCGPSRRSR